MNDPQAIPVVPPLPLARTDQPAVFHSQVTLAAAYNFVDNGGIAFVRDTVQTPWSGIRFIDKDDELLPNGQLHYGGWLMDWAGLGGYHCWYDNKLDVDLFKIGFRGEQIGRFALGVDPISPNVQFQIHDIATAIDWSIATWSQHNGIQFKSRSPNADGFVVARDNENEQKWLSFQQGDGTYNWRIGMVKGLYDLVLYSGTGQTTSPANPGTEIFRLSHDGTLTNKTVADLAARVAALEAKLNPI